MKKPGFVALISVIIISSIVLSIGIWMIFTNLNASLAGLTIRQSQQARALAKSCAESALLQLANDFNNINNNSLTYPEGFCDYNILVINANSKRINVSANVDNIIRKESLDLSLINNNLLISSWQELADF